MWVRVHALRIRAKAPRLAAFGRDDVELAVRHQQHVVLGLAEDDPLPVGRELREEVALAVVGGARDRLGRAAPAFVEGHPVEIELERLLVLDELRDVVLVEQDGAGVRDAALPVDLRSREDDRLPVGAPGRVALDVRGVVGARERRVGAGLGVVDHEDALDREEELGELDAGRRHEHRAVLDGADHVAAVGRDLGEEPEGELAVVPLVVAPGDDLLVVEDHLLGDGEDGVATLVVAVVDVEAEHAAVARERVAVPADGEVFEDDGRPGLGVDRAEAPADARRVLDGVDERERNLPIEDGVAHRVGGGADAEARGGDGRRALVDAEDRHLAVARLGAPLDLGPVRLRRSPARLAGREPEHLVGLVEPEQHPPRRNTVGLVVPDEGRGDDLRGEQRLIEGVRDLQAAGRLARKRERCRLGSASTGGEDEDCGEQEHRRTPGANPGGRGVSATLCALEIDSQPTST
jgi:hypothetical protein